MNVFDKLESMNSHASEKKLWSGTFRDFLKKYEEEKETNANIGVLAHQRLYNMILAGGAKKVDHFGKERISYGFFEENLYGIEDSLDEIVQYLHSAAQKTETSRRMLLMYGPPSSGKSDIINHLKKGLETYTRTAEGAIFALSGTKMHENPFLLIPEKLRGDFERQFGLRIEGQLSPTAAYRLKEEFHGKFMDYPVEQIYINEATRVGIGTWLPQDPKGQDQSELVGGIDFAKIQEYGDEADPRTYNFNGELNVANRGIMEFIEGLKSDERFLRVLLTATQEKMIKAPRFGLIYCDTVIVLHSVHPDELVPIREEGTIKLVQISSLLRSPERRGEDTMGVTEAEQDYSRKNIQVLSVDERTRQPVWSKIKRVLCHQYKGDVLQLQQKYGDVLVSPNHSVYNQDFRLFDAKDHDKNELLTISHVPQENVADEVILARWCQNIYVEDHLVLKKTEKQATVRSGVINNISADKVPAFLRVLAAYIAEGHLLGPKDAPTGVSISQQSLAWLQSLKTDFEILSNGVKPYLNSREEADDHTSRLEIHSISWAHIIKQLCGRYSNGKRVPNFVFNMSYDMKMLFLGALIEGDGSRKIRSSCFGQELSEEYLKNYFSYTTVSRDLASGFCFLCKMCGVSVSIHSRSKTSTGKNIYHITYVRYPRNQNTKTVERSDFNGYLYDIEVDTPHAHNFVCGVGSVVCHNTNEEEFKNFMAEKKYEAYHDRMIIVKVPYNLSVSNEVKIYEKLLNKSDAIKNMHIAPKTLQAAAMFAVLTRLASPPEGGELTLAKKMKLYDKQHVRGYKIEQVPDMKRKEPKEGMQGVSPRFIIDQISASIARANDEGRDYITALDVLRQLNRGVFGRDSFTQDKKNHFESLIDEARSEWDDFLRNDIQKAFFVSYEKEARNLCENYLDQIDAACSGTKPRDPVTGDEIDLDEKLMDSVEEQIEITSSGKEDFRNEMLRAVGAAARANKKFDYTQHSQLREAIQKKLFEERKNVIRMTVSTRNPDPDELKRINDVVARMVDQQGYSTDAANALLKYATAHLFDK